jgi:hypothetical protein
MQGCLKGNLFAYLMGSTFEANINLAREGVNGSEIF